MKITFGGIYKANKNIAYHLPNYRDRLNHQNYNFWFPIRVVTEEYDKTYMIDTYQFEVPYGHREFDKMVEFLVSLGEEKDHSWLARKPFDYYYSARVEITDYSINAFELIADLRECELVSREQSRYYNKEDTNWVMFWNYQNSDRGVYIKNKSIKTIYDLKINALIRDIEYDLRFPTIGNYKFNEFLNVVKRADESGSEYNKKKVDNIVKLKKYLDRASKNYYRYIKRLEKSKWNILKDKLK